MCVRITRAAKRAIKGPEFGYNNFVKYTIRQGSKESLVSSFPRVDNLYLQLNLSVLFNLLYISAFYIIKKTTWKVNNLLEAILKCL